MNRVDAARIIEQDLYAVIFEAVTSDAGYRESAELADEIWHEHYEAILGKAQVDYMVDKFQSEKAIKEQILQEGYEYYLFKCFGGTCGYLSIRKEQESLFLSKFYVAKEFRGRGLARQAMNYLEQLGRDAGLSRIWLTVNRDNTGSIQIYESLGFSIAGTKVAEIGGGFVMDDFLMEKVL